jgi:toxin ParE1/3/4
MRRVEWTQDALADIIAEAEHIAKDDPEAAERVAAAIRASGTALGPFATGRSGQVAGTYEKSVHCLPHILAYALTGTAGPSRSCALSTLHAIGRRGDGRGEGESARDIKCALPADSHNNVDPFIQNT